MPAVRRFMGKGAHVRYIDMSEACRKRGNCSRNTIYLEVANGALPAPFKIGQRNFWLEHEFDAALVSLAERAKGQTTNQAA